MLSAERAFHESVNTSLLRNVQPVTEWIDLPRFARTMDITTALASDSPTIEDKASEILDDTLSGISTSKLSLVVVSIKSEQRLGESPRVDMVQLRTKDGIYIFTVQDICSS